jgi:alpha-L-rhamnosidase
MRISVVVKRSLTHREDGIAALFDMRSAKESSALTYYRRLRAFTRSVVSGILCMAVGAGVACAQTAIQPVELTTELQTNPLGVDLATPRLGWNLAALDKNAHGLDLQGYQIQVAANRAALQAGHGEVWDSGHVVAKNTWQVRYAGTLLLPARTYYWRVRAWDGAAQAGPWSATAIFTTGLLRSDWKADWIASPFKTQSKDAPLPVFRKAFTVQPRVEQALLFVSGLGQYEAHLNGQSVTATVMNPGWTDYRKTVLYNTYDVTKLLRPGANVMGVLLGNGMYNVKPTAGRYSKFTGSFGAPKLRLQLAIRYTDGTEEQVLSDDSWLTHQGPITFSSIYGGEDDDARLLARGWDRAGFDASGWVHAEKIVEGPGGALLSAMEPPMVIADRLKPIRITHPRPGVTVYDLGKNMSGWPEITVIGTIGAQVTLLAGELLKSDGTVTQKSAAAGPSAPVLFRYTLRGGEAEHWHPRFSYYGFRYVQVTVAAPNQSESATRILGLEGDFVHADVSIAGQFSSSNSLFNKIHGLIDRAVLSNLASIVTDCPTREKLGWLEQTYLNAGTLMLNYDVRGLYEKMTHDEEDAQLADGLIPSIAPEYVAFVDDSGKNTDFRDSPEWGSAIVLGPWALYQITGDREPLIEAYPSMRRYLAYLGARSKGHLLDYGLGDWYDIGPGAPGPSKLTSRYVTATATYYEDLQAMAAIATIAERPEEIAGYKAEAVRVRDAFNAKLFDPSTGRYDRGSQTAESMPLALGIVPDGHQQQVLDLLISDIHGHQDHVTAGDVGFHYLVRALTDAGRGDVLAAMLSRTDAPSYGYQLNQSATTLTEAWDSNPDSSQNHFMLGHAEEWFYRGLAGIQVDMGRGIEDAIWLKPLPVAQVSHAEASERTAMGIFRSTWKRIPSGSVVFTVEIPVGAHARLWLPVANGATVTSLQAQAGVSAAAPGNGNWEARLGSGLYRFRVSRVIEPGLSPH